VRRFQMIRFVSQLSILISASPKSANVSALMVCPLKKTGKVCIDVKPTSTICISENLYIGCGMCVKKCPFEAIQIINLPKGLESQVNHR